MVNEALFCPLPGKWVWLPFCRRCLHLVGTGGSTAAVTGPGSAPSLAQPSLPARHRVTRSSRSSSRAGRVFKRIFRIVDRAVVMLTASLKCQPGWSECPAMPGTHQPLCSVPRCSTPRSKSRLQSLMSCLSLPGTNLFLCLSASQTSVVPTRNPRPMEIIGRSEAFLPSAFFFLFIHLVHLFFKLRKPMPSRKYYICHITKFPSAMH